MKRRIRRMAAFLPAFLLIAVVLFHSEAHPQPTNVTMSYGDGWKFHYTDGHTSKGGYFHVMETGEPLFCLEPHMNDIESSRDTWITSSQYFNDAAFAGKIDLIAYYGENSGWGMDGWAAAQSLIWKYIMERNGETGEQWISTASITTREQLQVYYDAIEQKIREYYMTPSFNGNTIRLQAGESITVKDSNGVLGNMDVEIVSGPIQVSKNGNQITIKATGKLAAKGTIRFKKPLSNGIEGNNFVYIAQGYQDLMTGTYYQPQYASLSVDITEAPVSVEFYKQDLTTGKELVGASLKVTDEKGKVIDSWTSGNTPHKINNLKNGSVYIMTETIPAPGYATAKSIRFTANHGGPPIIMKDDITKIEISKVDITTGEEVEGARLQVADTKGTVIDEWTSGKESHKITNLTVGQTYCLTEMHPADGYVTAKAVEFTVEDTGKIQHVIMEDDITKIEISKVDITTGEEVEGARLQVADVEGTVIDEWTSGKEPHKITNLTVGQTYRLTETHPADGYVTAKTIEFTVEDTGEIQHVIMEDDITKIEISKVDITTGEEVEGARLQVADVEGTVIDEWTSGKEPHKITNLTVGQTYRLTETHPADGYVTARTIEFRVEDTGEIQHVRMEDDITKVEIFKRDIDSQKAVSGAVLQIIDQEGAIIEEWVSGEKPQMIEKLTAEETYILHEKTAPKGYLTAEDVVFTVSDTGEIQTVAIEDELAVISLEVAKTTIRRTQTGDTYKYTITKLKNSSNTALENFTCTDYLPNQVMIQELHTGTFTDELEYTISYQTSFSKEWHVLAEGLNSVADHIVSFTEIPLKAEEQVTAYRYEFGTAPAGFQIGEKSPVYFTTVKDGVDVNDEMLTNITLSGDWRGAHVTDEDDTVTLLFEGEIDLHRSIGRVLTGDTAPIIFLIFSGGISVVTLLTLFIKQRKKHRQD
ncbi:MAG: hypothetical protein HFI68_01690 [Lachnospiraceae bacterium]|nr:hypothetical protein [Lachnospiraceae bacterium]